MFLNLCRENYHPSIQSINHHHHCFTLPFESLAHVSRNCFTDVHQLLSLLLSGNIVSILDDEIRSNEYPLVALPVGNIVLKEVDE